MSRKFDIEQVSNGFVVKVQRCYSLETEVCLTIEALLEKILHYFSEDLHGKVVIEREGSKS